MNTVPSADPQLPPNLPTSIQMAREIIGIPPPRPAFEPPPFREDFVLPPLLPKRPQHNRRLPLRRLSFNNIPVKTLRTILRCAVERPRQWNWISSQPGVDLPAAEVEKICVELYMKLARFRMLLQHPDDVGALPDRFFKKSDGNGHKDTVILFNARIRKLRQRQEIEQKE
jgi:hypothetical protein